MPGFAAQRRAGGLVASPHDSPQGLQYPLQERLAGLDWRVPDNSVGDSPMLPGLLGQIPSDEPMASVSGDGACDPKACRAAIAQREEQAVIPPRKNAQAWKTTLAGAAVRNDALRACHRLGRSI